MFKHEMMDFEPVNTITLHDKVGRYYETPTGIFRSVTTILGEAFDKSGLEEWKKRVGEEQAAKVSIQAANRGTAIHKLCEDYVLNKENFARGAMPVNIMTFQSIKRELDKHVETIYGVEVPLYSGTLETAGRTDLLASYDGVMSIIDFKTSKRLKEEKWIESYFIQATCYSMMVEELKGISIPQFVIIIAVDDEPNAQVFVKKTNDYRHRVREIFIKK
jgi:genome maintenance exonuclease 1